MQQSGEDIQKEVEDIEDVCRYRSGGPEVQ